MAWDATKPDGDDYLADSDDDIRANFSALQSAIGQDHDFDGTTQTGKHEQITLVEAADIGTGSEGQPILGAQTASGKAELVFTDEDDNDIQLTSGGSINGAALKADSVDSAAYAAASIDNEHLADDAVDSDEIADGAVDTDHLFADCVDGTKIADDAVDSEHIASGAVDADHLSSGAKTSGLTSNSYDSGWFAVSTGNVYTKTHSLGTTKVIAKLYFSASSGGSNSVEVSGINDTGSSGTTKGGILKNITTTQISAESGDDGVAAVPDGSGNVPHNATGFPTSGYYRIVVLALE